MSDRGAVVLIGTPIGNLGDLSPRAVEELAAADVVACEDTRRTGRLLEHAGISARRLVVMNDHTEGDMAEELVAAAEKGQRIAVVTDGGMPAVADPGQRLVAAAAAAGVEVVVVPGPSAAVAAVALSGFGSGRFVFEGFLPRKGEERRRRLAELATQPRMVVLFESPQRVQRSLTDLAEAFGGERRVAICREMTKLHEDVWRGTLAEAVAGDIGANPKGEHVLVTEGAPPPAEDTDDELRSALAAERERGATTRDAVDAVAAAHGASRRRVYDLAVGG